MEPENRVGQSCFATMAFILLVGFWAGTAIWYAIKVDRIEATLEKKGVKIMDVWEFREYNRSKKEKEHGN